MPQPTCRNARLAALATGALLVMATLPAAAARPGIDDVRFKDVRTVRYQCDGGKTLTVRYFNGAENQAAILRPAGKPMLFVNVVSGSGARYVAGPYEWWTKGHEGTLRDLMQGENAAPVYANCQAEKATT